MEWITLGALAIAFAFARRWFLDQAAARRLAGRIGFQPVEVFAHHPPEWFTGVVHGRRVAIGVIRLRGAVHAPFQSSVPHLCVAMQVNTRLPLNAFALRSHLDPSSLHRFEEAFRVEHREAFNQRAQAAMLHFVKRGYPSSSRWRRNQECPNARNLRLCARDRVPATELPAHVLAVASSLLLHHHPRLHLSADEFGQLLSELAVVAAAMEDSIIDSNPTAEFP